MKKIISIVLVSALALSLAACSSGTTTDEYGNEVKNSGGYYRVYPEELPCTVPFGKGTVTLESVDYYENLSNHEYSFYVILRFYMAKLTEDERYWLEKENFTISIDVTNEDNELDEYSLYKMGSGDIDREYIIGYFAGNNKSYRYSLAGSEINVQIIMSESGESSMKRVINYTDTVPDKVPSTDEMDIETHRCYGDWLANWNGMFSY